MTTEKKIKKLKSQGWSLTFCDSSFIHEASRGFVKVKAKSINELYKKCKQIGWE